jgi:para-nitrobenzyl esterase
MRASLLLIGQASFLVAAFLGSQAAAQIQSLGPVQLDSGKISGSLGGRNNEISVYKGIPYAAPPVGDLRWRPPQPVKPWDTVRDATKFGAIQPQRSRFPSGPGAVQSEDSLYLNVWTPAKRPDERLPVMVWIHGGGFTFGSSSQPTYDGTRLAEAGVVLVSMNYRLNVLGGFAHPLLSKESERGVSGNYGILDQIAALEWVKRNIAAFGGDPGTVTIFGESAGGISVSVLMVSPLTKGLFHRAIVESGSTGRIGTLQSAEKAGEDLVKKLGLEKAPNLLAKLRAMPWEDIPDAASFRGGPVVDGWMVNEQPGKTCKEGKQHNVPMIVGYNRDEATFFARGPVPKTIDEFRDSVRKRYKASADKILALYPVKSDDDVYWAAMHLATDAGLGVSAPNQLRGMFNVSSKAWFYHFSHVTPGPRVKTMGVPHAAELAYVFGTLSRTARKADRDVSDAIIGYWTQFAKSGNPNRPGLPEWRAFEKGNECYLDLGDEITCAKDFKKDRIEVLEAFSGR